MNPPSNRHRTKNLKMNLKPPILVLLSTFLFSSAQLPPPPPPDYDQCGILTNDERFDCFPQSNSNQEGCESRGCCWLPVEKLDVPYCFYPPNYPTYDYLNITENDSGFVAFLSRTASSAIYPRDVEVIKLEMTIESEDRVRIKITDPTSERFESPYPEIDVEKASKRPARVNYRVKVTRDHNIPGFQVVRTSDGTVIFDTTVSANFIFSDQFLQLSAKLSSKHIYGLGEHRGQFLLSTDWKEFSFLNHDHPPEENLNLYGAHPFYLAIEESGNAHGVFLKNSNPMDIILQPTPAITYRPIGGILDLYFFFGPTPSDVIKQYTDLIGRPYLPPYWGLGFHLCRYGYGTLDNTKEVMQRNIDAGIPLDTQWNDLDYMESNNGFTYNKDTFAGLPEFVQDLHDNGMHFIPIIDPGVSGSEPSGTYPPFDLGVEMDVFVKDQDGEIFYGKVWNPVSTVWPDFTHPNATDYWYAMLLGMHQDFAFDGAWIDMNEPANFYDGTLDGCPDSELEHPVYVPGVDGGLLSTRTVCMTARQYAGLHYNVHNLYGISEAQVTNRALARLRGDRPMIISRSSFAGHGRYAGHWSGDIFSSWNDMRYTIPELLSFSLFGIPLMGADICGFNGDSNAPLCNRWHQLGAFYPFSRNHNTLGAIDQDPVGMGEQVTASAKKALTNRYHLLPYLYTLFFKAHVYGETVARPIFFEFPADQNTYNLDTHFLWGPGLLIIPVLEEDSTQVNIYLPAGVWYNYYDHSSIESQGEEIDLDADLETIPLLVRGGFILPQQQPEQTTTRSRLNKIELLVALDQENNAAGDFYWDDGNTIEAYEQGLYSLIEFNLSDQTLESQVLFWGPENPPNLGMVTIMGVDDAVGSVTVNNVNTPYSHDTVNKVLFVEGLDISLGESLTLTWT